MNKEAIHYLKHLQTEDLADYKKLLNEGRKIGGELPSGTNKFLREHHIKNEIEYRKKMTAEGKVMWRAIMGLPTIDMQIDALNKLYEYAQNAHIRIDFINQIPNILSGVPEECRDESIDYTGFALIKQEDYVRLSEVVPIQSSFPDSHLISPRAVETTINSIRVGANYVGAFAQFIWGFPNYCDDKKHMEEVIKALGIMAAKRDDMFIVDTYLDDGIPGYCMDYASFIGYALLEKYIVSDLCGARYVASYGQLWSDSKMKMGALLALSDLLKTEDQPGVGYVYGNAIDHWKENLVGNYGITASEYLMQILVERKYKTGAAIQTIPITEQISVPTVEAVEDILAVCNRLEERAYEWDDLIDFTKIEEYRDRFKEIGIQFFHNILDGFQEANIDVENPLQIIWTLRKMDPLRFEVMFHPSVFNNNIHEFTPYYPSSIVKQSIDVRDHIIKRLRDNGDGECLKGKKIIVVSADLHRYGAFVVDNVLQSVGGEVINGGVSVDAAVALDIADEEDAEIICVSVHNGQSLDYANQLLELARERNGEYKIFMGGKLNASIPDSVTPVDVTDKLNHMGIYATEDLFETVQKIRRI